jgi:tetratricopeptide (TPR) repeat protein
MAADLEDEIERLRIEAATDPSARPKLADFLSMHGRAAEAIMECRMGLEEQPEDIPLLLALGRALSAEGELDEAQSMFTRAASLKKSRSAATSPNVNLAVSSRGVDVAQALGPPMSSLPAKSPAKALAEAAAMAYDDEATNVRPGSGKPKLPPLPVTMPTPMSALHPPVMETPAPDTDPEGEPPPRPKQQYISPTLPTPDPTSTPTPTPTPTPMPPVQMAPSPLQISPAPYQAARPAAARAPVSAPRSAAAAAPVRAPTPVAAPAVRPPAPARAPTPVAAPAVRGPALGETRTPTVAGTPSARAAAPAPRTGGHAPAPQRGPIDLDAVAAQLHGKEVALLPVAPPPADENVARGFHKARRRVFIWLWAALGAITAGIGGGTWYRVTQIRALIAQKVAVAKTRGGEATYDGDLAAREAVSSVLSSRLHERKHIGLTALAGARLFADHGDDAEPAVQALLKRAEKEAAAGRDKTNDPTVEVLFHQARALLALGHGEPCPNPEALPDGAIAARCMLRHGDGAGAKKSLDQALANDPNDVRALLELAAMARDDGDLDAAEDADRKVLAIVPDHPRALVGQVLTALERGKVAPLGPPGTRLGPVAEAWWNLGLAENALARGDENTAASELDAAQPGALRDGRLAARIGLARLSMGKVSEAERALRVAARLVPIDAEVGALDAEIAVAKGFEEKVAQQLAVKEGRPPLTPRLLAIRGRAEVLAGKPRDGAASLDAALAKRPGDVVAATYRALAHARIANVRSAVNELERLIAAHPTPTTPHYGLGLLAIERHDLSTARSELSKAMVHDPEAFRAGAALGRVDKDLGRYNEAVGELEKVVQDDESLLGPHTTLGHLYHELGRDVEARNELRRTVDAKKATADDQLALAEATINLGQLNEADKMLATAQTAGVPAPRIARARLVLASWQKGPTAASAAKGLEKLHKGAPKDASLAIDAGNAWRRAGDGKKAAEMFKAALGTGKDAFHGNLGLGRALMSLNDFNGAEAAFRAALDASVHAPYGEEDKSEARVGVGRALLGKKAFTDAVGALETARDEDTEAPEPRFWLAKAYAEVNDAPKARAEAERATALDDGYKEAWLLLADLTEKIDKPVAANALKKYLELIGDTPAAKPIKRRLANLK